MVTKPKWLSEPYRHEFEYRGYPVIMIRTRNNLTWCGYVGIHKGHPWFEKDYNEIPANAHGGLTYSSMGHGSPQDEWYKPPGLWWIGFDCAHVDDLTPGIYYSMLKAHMDKLEAEGMERMLAWKIAKNQEMVKMFEDHLKETARVQYRDMSYVEEECALLAEQVYQAL